MESKKPHKVTFELGGDDIKSKTASPKFESTSEAIKVEEMTIRKQKGMFGASINLVALARNLEKK